MIWFLSLIPLELFARAGGGGSGGGGGGGGGSGSGSGGGGGLAFLGWLIGTAISAPLKKILGRDKAMILAAIIMLVLTLAGIVIGAQYSHTSIYVWPIVIETSIGLWIAWGTTMFGPWEKLRKHFKKADEDLAAAGWDEESLKQRASEVFMRYQDDWSRRDASRFAEYMTPEYASHANLLVRTLIEMKRVNTMTDPRIMRMDTSKVSDSTDDSQDRFSIVIEASAKDTLYDEISQKELINSNTPFMEEWSFRRSGSTWLLSGIRQFTENVSQKEADMIEFSNQNSMYYSLDMGWLFLPSRGQLFSNKYTFGYSDINNHVVGTYHNNLVQMYTYSQAQDQQRQSSKTYLVGQVAVPKEYGGILIERKKGIVGRLFAPKDYQKYEFEWPDFNNRYNVYATDQSRLAAFELLNPGFMAYLYDNFNDISIEVVDNIVYFYALKKATRNDYDQLMQLLMKSFKELQL